MRQFLFQRVPGTISYYIEAPKAVLLFQPQHNHLFCIKISEKIKKFRDKVNKETKIQNNKMIITDKEILRTVISVCLFLIFVSVFIYLHKHVLIDSKLKNEYDIMWAHIDQCSRKERGNNETVLNKSQ